MPIITMPNNKQFNYDYPITLFDILNNINPELVKTVIAGQINNKLVETDYLILDNVKLNFIFADDKQGLSIIRNSCIFLLGYTIKKLWPNAKIATGNITDNGFYYDIDLKHTLTLNDINEIEQNMYSLVKSDHRIIKKKISLREAQDIFTKHQEEYKLAILSQDIYQNKKVTLYIYDKYIEIYNKPNILNIKFCQYFKLIKTSIIYWEDNKSNKRKALQRIYGTAWADKKSLNTYLYSIKDNKKRDHRKIGKQLNLYHIQEDSPGMVFWHNDGWIIFRELKKFIRAKLIEYQYKEVKTPIMMDRMLWKKTGHWDYYNNVIFTTVSESRKYCVKPMNCPGHIEIFKQDLKSYRDLPLRMAEFGSCHRNEPSGSLHGLMRVRGFTQDDAHIFCTEKQIRNEISSCIRMIYDIYHIFGFKKITVKLSGKPDKHIGNDVMWNRAEKDLEEELKKNNVNFEYQPGEGAFYGPKIEFTLYDCLDRAWQCGTVQLDLSLPQLLNATYINENNQHQVPIMIHRAVLGSIERFIGILIEEFAGCFPTWLAPIQVVVMNITDSQFNYAQEVTKKFQNVNIRVISDLRNDTIGFKIHKYTLRHVPYILICGDKEMKSQQVSVRTRSGKNLGRVDINNIIKRLLQEINNRSLKQLEE